MKILRRGVSRSGSILVLFAVGLLSLVAFVGLVVDGGYAFTLRQRLQFATDSAALAAALAIPQGSSTMQSEATKYMNANPIGAAYSIQVNHPFGGNANRVEIVATATYNPSFLAALGWHSLTITTRAVGQRAGGGGGGGGSNVFARGYTGLNYLKFTGNGAISDSYDSSRGAYNAVVNGVTNRGSAGNLFSNGPIRLDGNTRINGAVQSAGTVVDSQGINQQTNNQPTNIFITGQAQVQGQIQAGGHVLNTGNGMANGGVRIPAGSSYVMQGQGFPNNGGHTTGAAPAPATLPDVDTTAVASSNSNASAIGQGQNQSPIKTDTNPPRIVMTDQADRVTLPAGTYYFTSLDIQSGTLTFNGPVNIFVKGTTGGNPDIRFGGQPVINYSTNPPRPGNVIIQYAGSQTQMNSGSEKIQLGSNNINYHMGIYAPRANMVVTAGSAVFGGAVTAGLTQQASPTPVHLDTSLNLTLGGGGGGGPTVIKLVE